MSRTADEVLIHHINAMMSLDFENAIFKDAGVIL